MESHLLGIPILLFHYKLLPMVNGILAMLFLQDMELWMMQKV